MTLRLTRLGNVALLLGVLLAATIAGAQHKTGIVVPGEPWRDNRGELIQAHGGGILHLKDTWYWFGEDRTETNDPARRYVACYSSTDLVHWTYRRQVVALAEPEDLGAKWILERPKVFYNRKTHKFVMYVHLDGPGPSPAPGSFGYNVAKVGILTSDTVDGDYKWVRSLRPLDQESRDIGQFIDDDGSAYLIFESRPTKGFFIARLSADYLNVESKVAFIDAPLEGGAIVHYKGLYYALGSHLTGWRPNPNVYATAPSLAGPWSTMRDIAPPETNTYNSQSSMLIKVTGSKMTSVLYVGDRWSPKALWDSRYIWMPLSIDGEHMTLPEPRPWSIDVETGVTHILQP
ncbi:family 43 glycosylhydrolase [Granulicella rosea]|nr:family 43 glycosylhydrolase [Granulicella rosea]